MNRLIERLSRRETDFTVEYCGFDNIWDIMADRLLTNPGALASLQSFECLSLSLAGHTSVRVRAVYEPSVEPVPVFLIKDSFDLLTAAALTRRLHLQTVKIVADNRGAKPFDLQTFYGEFSKFAEIAGEEFAPHQTASYRHGGVACLDNRIIIYTCSCQYFDSAESVNLVKCAAALQADGLRRRYGSGGPALIEGVLQWMKRNVSYLNNDLSADHSAVGLFVNGTAVCQGIAVYAYQLLVSCGIPARVVFGDGSGSYGWEPHAWNMIRLGGGWVHIDYTFALGRESVFESEEAFRREHRWDEAKYGAAYSDEMISVRNTLKRSVITVLPETACFAVNGCILDMSRLRRPCVTAGSVLCIAADFFFRFCGGCSGFAAGRAVAAIDEDLYILPLSDFIRRGDLIYIPIVKLRELGFSVKTQGHSVVLQR